MYHHKNLNNFIRNDDKITIDSSHTTYFVEKIKNSTIKSRWVLKEIKHPIKNLTATITKRYESEAIEETVAQEFFRLLHPASPKTRWIKETHAGIDHYFVLSKEVEGFDTSFLSKPNIYNAIENGSIRGFATVLLIALLLREIDLNRNNIGMDSNGNIVKIDGGLCFAHLKENYFGPSDRENINFTRIDIEALPELSSYRPFNWVDLRMWRKAKHHQEAPHTTLGLSKNTSPAFKQELYKTILLICLLPSDLIYSFTAAYSPDPKKADSLAIDIINQIKKLECIAAQIPDFLNYRISIKAELDIIDYTLYLKTFNTMGKSNLLDSVHKSCHLDVADYIFNRYIQGYLSIKNLSNQLDDIKPPSNPNANALIEPLKNKIAAYLTCPSHLNRRIVYKMLCDTKDKILDFNSAKRSLTTFSINSLSNYLKHLEKTTATARKRRYCMTKEATPPTGAKKRKIISFFNNTYNSNDTEGTVSTLEKAFNL